MKHLIAAILIGMACLATSPIHASDASSEFFQGKEAYKEKHYEEAFISFQKAANADHAEAQLWLASMYRAGLGTTKDTKTGVDWLLKSAKNKNAEAAYRIGAWYTHSTGEYDKGTYWLVNALMLGSAAARQELDTQAGNLLTYKTKQVSPTLLSWIKATADDDYAQNQFILGQLFFAGRGVEQNLAKAIEWTEKAGENGHVPAQMGLAFFYSQGPKNERNGQKAFYWMTKAAQAYHPDALFRVGTAYVRDEKAPNNVRSKGADMVITSARMGFVQAQYGAAELFATGDGVPRDLEKALMWFHIAEKNGLKESIGARDFYLQKSGFKAGAKPFSGRSLSSAKACWNTDYAYNCGDHGQLPPEEVKTKYAEFLAKRYQQKKQGSALGPKEIWR